MKSSKTEARQKIEKYFLHEKLDSKKTKKIKKLAMAHEIRLKEKRKRFCKKCFSDLRLGKVRISKSHKSVFCQSCGFKNKFKI